MLQFPVDEGKLVEFIQNTLVFFVRSGMLSMKFELFSRPLKGLSMKIDCGMSTLRVMDTECGQPAGNCPLFCSDGECPNVCVVGRLFEVLFVKFMPIPDVQ